MRKIIQVAALYLVSFSAFAEAHGITILFSSDWTNGIDKRIQYQEPRPDSIEPVKVDGGDLERMIKVTIYKGDDYTHVANGAPRAELSFNGFIHFEQKREYLIKWEIYIPEDYRFDTGQAELVAQIHQGPAAGYPPFALFFSGDGKYEVHNRTQSNIDSVNVFFGNLVNDRGHRVRWELHYIPDATGEGAVTELKKDGEIVYATRGVRNAYEGDEKSYLKLGIYKADWLKKPSDVDSRILYYGPVSVRILK
ncbi:heparin lyase I family protein [Paraburkholderia sp. EG287A]|uniref:heparin lyase I family protein n=1 Tax=unclassified Paraburkholderia TaxID=2615204 RepID=UPI0034D2EAD0